MTITTTVDLSTLTPLSRSEAIELGRVEYVRFVDALESLAPDDWRRETDCTGWTVRDVAGHLAGSMRSVSTLRDTMAEQRAVKRRAKATGETEVDAMTALQIESAAELTTDELIARMRSLVDAAADGRRRLPGVMAKIATIKVDLGTIKETWKLDYLLGKILTRDTWLHRVSDLARAVDRAPVLDGEHDGRIVADIAAEWARRHGAAVDLTLTGPAGGHFVAAGAGGSAATIELDAIEFCRILSERAEPTHQLLATPVPF